MPTEPGLRPSVLAAREQLAEGLAKSRAQHDAGTPAVQLCARLAELTDAAVRRLYDAALADLAADGLHEVIALVPLAGYGRRDVAPYSDADLLFLHTGARASEVEAFVKRLLSDLYDAGLKPGHCVHTPAQAIEKSQEDVTLFTSLVESRFLAGNELLHQEMRQKFRKMSQRRFRTLHDAIIVERRAERVKYGETVYLLAPNVKRSRGALREIQLARWIAFARFGMADPEQLNRSGALNEHDLRILQLAKEFLLRVRNDLHFESGRSQDVLSRPEQMRIAEKFAYLGKEGIHPAEQFMQEYFRHTSQVRHLVARFTKALTPTPLVRGVIEPIFSHHVEGHYRVGVGEIAATTEGLTILKKDVGEVLRLASLSNQTGKRISNRTWDVVSRAAPSYPDELSPQIIERFCTLLSQSAQLGKLLRRLHELHVLEKIIPGFRHARHLMQLNDYHKYTVDEHTLRAVAAANDFEQRDDTLGEAYHGLRKKQTLHLALLLHDLGKGFSEDHSVVGARIAEETCRRLQLDEQESSTIIFLVEHHLCMSNLAFRRDTSDPQVISDFAEKVGTADVLTMLFVLSCADLEAVGPGVLNEWKIGVLTDLFRRTKRLLQNDIWSNPDDELAARKKAIDESLTAENEDEAAWFARQVDGLPDSYVEQAPVDQVVRMLESLKNLHGDELAVWAEYCDASETVVYTAVTKQGHDRGLFSRLTGGLSSQGLEILSANIQSLADDAVLDEFTVRDLDFTGAPPVARIEEVCSKLVEIAAGKREPKFRRLWKTNPAAEAPEAVRQPTRLTFDNQASESFTILEVFAHDRHGLLYAIARTLRELKLSIGAAKIGTNLDQVVDVFYIRNQQGRITDDDKLTTIRERLLSAIESVEK